VRGLRFAPPPRPLATLVGWDAEAAHIAALPLRENARLVTLTGPGGVREVVAFISFTSVAHEDEVLPKVARVLGVRADGPEVAGAMAARLGLV
jgi:hypothetical protein